MRLIDADALVAVMYHEAFETDSDRQKWDSGCWIRYKMFEEHIANAPTVAEWIPLSHDDGLGTDFPYEHDGEWVIVTDGNTISVERIKKDAYDHFFPNGRWFELEDVVAWMPLPEPYMEEAEE